MRPRGRFKCKNNALGTYIKIILTTYLSVRIKNRLPSIQFVKYGSLL